MEERLAQVTTVLLGNLHRSVDGLESWKMPNAIFRHIHIHVCV